MLLVPGYGGGTGGLEQLANRLRAAGRQATVVPLPGDGTGDLDAQATALDVAVRSALAAGAPSVDLVGYSAGGVVARLWARDHDGAARARRIVTLGSPHHGTDLAAVAGLLAPDSCPPACQQLAPDSDLIAGLNSGDETPDGPAWVSIWTSQDQVVTPPDTARLVGASNVVVQRICPGRASTTGSCPRTRWSTLSCCAPSPRRRSPRRRARTAARWRGWAEPQRCAGRDSTGRPTALPADVASGLPSVHPISPGFVRPENERKQRRWPDESTDDSSSIGWGGSSGPGSSPGCRIISPGR